MKKHLSLNTSHLKNTIFLILLLSASTCFAHSWMAPENEAKRENPVKISNESKAIGKELFIDLCSSCHGINGTGLKKQETGLSKDTPGLPSRLSTHSDGDFHWKIKNGKGEMPSFSDELTDTEVWHIINFLKEK